MEKKQSNVFDWINLFLHVLFFDNEYNVLSRGVFSRAEILCHLPHVIVY